MFFTSGVRKQLFFQLFSLSNIENHWFFNVFGHETLQNHSFFNVFASKSLKNIMFFQSGVRKLLFFRTNSHWSSATSFAPKASKLMARLDFPDPERPTIKTPEPLTSTQEACIISEPLNGIFISNFYARQKYKLHL